jgi:16S rRNA (cytosine967-C5)-methyltransferase
MKPSPGVQPRVIAARVVDAVLHHGRSLKAELAQALPALADPRDRALVEAMCFAVLREPTRFEAALSAWMPKPLPRRDNELKALLYVGLAQLDPLALPAHAALAATVDAARSMKRNHQAGLVNALLRRAQREGIPPADIRAHWPRWLRERIAADWPQDEDAVFQASAAEPPMWLRVNRRVVSPGAYREQLAQAGLHAQPDEAAPEALRLDTPVAVATLPGFDDGVVSIQDASAQLVADALAPAHGARVLDACVAPGGKAAHLLERDASLQLTAVDIDPQRLQRVRGNLQRLGLQDVARLVAADAADTAAWWDGEPFDAVLLDAPCSATGIVRRQPDVLLHRRASDLDALAATQARLLDALWTTVAPGGVLLYATCSILKAENEAQVDAFLARTADAQAEPLDERYGRVAGAGRQRLPGERGYDGFYYARLRKRPA